MMTEPKNKEQARLAEIGRGHTYERRESDRRLSERRQVVIDREAAAASLKCDDDWHRAYLHTLLSRGVPRKEAVRVTNEYSEIQNSDPVDKAKRDIREFTTVELARLHGNDD